eukprot:3372218-Pyramimonas_sp.AAC.1
MAGLNLKLSSTASRSRLDPIAVSPMPRALGKTARWNGHANGCRNASDALPRRGNAENLQRAACELTVWRNRALNGSLVRALDCPASYCPETLSITLACMISLRRMGI